MCVGVRVCASVCVGQRKRGVEGEGEVVLVIRTVKREERGCVWGLGKRTLVHLRRLLRRHRLRSLRPRRPRHPPPVVTNTNAKRGQLTITLMFSPPLLCSRLLCPALLSQLAPREALHWQ